MLLNMIGASAIFSNKLSKLVSNQTAVVFLGPFWIDSGCVIAVWISECSETFVLSKSD